MVSTPRRPGSVDPDELGRREFSRARKGWDPVEVRAHLLSMAEELKRLQGREFELESKVSGLEQEVAERSELDESRLTQMLGEETARVLEAAREAANEVRARAHSDADALQEEARATAERTRAEAEELRQAASRESDELVAEARRRVDEMVADARRQAEELRSAAEADAAAARDRADRTAREKVAEAEADAERVRGAAQATREEAEGYAERTRREAEQHATTVRNEADRHAEEVRTDADAVAERIRSESQAAAERRSEEAAEAAEAELEAAREEGRRMVLEARGARERMLRDLAERRQTARKQLEALRAGRERLLEAFGAARAAFDDATDELTDALPAARAAADAAARTVDEDLEAAVAELDEAIGGGEPADREGGDDDGGPGEEPADAAPTDDRGEDAEEGAAAGPGPAGGAGSPPTGPTRLRLVPGAGPGHESLPADAPGEPGALDEADGDSQVEEIFARLRADQPPGAADEAGDPESVGPVDEESAEGGAAAGDGEAGAPEDPVRLPEGQVIDLGRAPAADQEHEDGTPGDEEPDGAEVTTSLLDRRDEALGDAERTAGRKLKRALSDAENAVLDRIQRSRKRRVTVEVLEDPGAAEAALWSALERELADVVAAGAGFLADDDHDRPVDGAAEVAAIRASVAEWVADPLRDHLERALGDAADAEDAPDVVRAVFREWKGEKVAELAGDLVTLAFNRGILAAAGAGTSHCWVVDHGGLPCPDAEDNHLAGPVVAGEPFPTGHVLPPAHPGCRCLLSPTPQ